MTLAVGWELAEYPTFVNSSPELAAAYRDTLSDLALALLGSASVAALAARQPRGESKPRGGAGAPEAALARACP
jgi:hypothetical protein